MSFKYPSESLHAHFNTGFHLNRYTAQFTLEHDFIRVIFKFFTRLQNLDIGYHLFIHSSSVAALSWSGSRWVRSLNWEHRIWGRNMCCITEHHAHTHSFTQVGGNQKLPVCKTVQYSHLSSGCFTDSHEQQFRRFLMLSKLLGQMLGTSATAFRPVFMSLSKGLSKTGFLLFPE